MPRPEDYTVATQLRALQQHAGLSARAIDSLLARFGSPAAILQADRAALTSLQSMTDEAAGLIPEARNMLPRIAEQLEALANRDIKVISRFDPEYGILLFELNDPPPLLYVRGSLPDQTLKSVTVIGSQEAGERGIELASDTARAFAEAGVQIISSLRGGVDVAAHLGATAGDGISFAVLDRGFDKSDDEAIIPVAIDISHNGGVISEYPPDTPFDHETIMASNRLLVCLSQAVVVTEVYQDSARTLDLLSFCRMIGKQAFMVVNPETGALADQVSLEKAVEFGVLPLQGEQAVRDIVSVLV